MGYDDNAASLVRSVFALKVLAPHGDEKFRDPLEHLRPAVNVQASAATMAWQVQCNKFRVALLAKLLSTLR